YMNVLLSFGMLVVTFTVALAEASMQPIDSPLDPTHAKTYFDEAQSLAKKDDGKLWGKKLYGPMFFVDYKNRAVIANQQDAKGVLRKKDGVFVGKLPEKIAPANTNIVWSGTTWTMIVWQMIPDNHLARMTMFAHEMFHRIQVDLKLSAKDKLNLHLDSAEGRTWLQLEWRALAAGLITQGKNQNQAIQDAVLFRKHRQKMFPGSEENERSLEIAEGVPEYTGLVIAVKDSASARWSTIHKLTNPSDEISFVRAFAYTSGPAYGILLDQRLPGWRTKLTSQSDLSDLLASKLKKPTAQAELRAKIYGFSEISNAESDRAAKIEITKAYYRKLLVDGPTLKFPASGEMRYTFNPSTLISLDGIGAVYPTFHVVGPWGTLNVTDGALRPKDLNHVIVAAPKSTKGSHIEGDGWGLDLLAGWEVVPSDNSKDFTVIKR
ncbi:MAG: hypothetical protein KDD22_05390, partial [Bdellovibrionales bacterium]|nr:hypothetical protein [Bdellovibrionales bacterium]